MVKKVLLGISMIVCSSSLTAAEATVPIKARILGGGLVITSSPTGIDNKDITFNFGELYKNNIPMRDDPDITPKSEKLYIKTTEGTLPTGSKIRVDLFSTTASFATKQTKYLTNTTGVEGKDTISHLVSTKFENVKILDHLQVGNTVDLANKTLRILGNENSSAPDYYGMRLKTCAILETENNSAIPVTVSSRIVETLSSSAKSAGNFSQTIYLGVQFSKTENAIWVRDCVQGVPQP